MLIPGDCSSALMSSSRCRLSGSTSAVSASGGGGVVRRAGGVVARRRACWRLLLTLSDRQNAARMTETSAATRQVPATSHHDISCEDERDQ